VHNAFVEADIFIPQTAKNKLNINISKKKT